MSRCPTAHRHRRDVDGRKGIAVEVLVGGQTGRPELFVHRATPSVLQDTDERVEATAKSVMSVIYLRVSENPRSRTTS